MYDKVQKIRERIEQWGYKGVTTIFAPADGMMYIKENICEEHPEIVQEFGLRPNKSDHFFDNGRLTICNQIRRAFYI